MSHVTFGAFVFDPPARLLSRAGLPVHLTAKATDLLDLLVARRPEAVAKKEIHEALWPNTFVSDVSLTTLIFELRTALGESARQPRFIRTVHGFGYAFPLDNAQAETDVRETPFCVVYDGCEVSLRAGENMLGRSRDCVVRLDSTRVSRHHARITVDDHAVVIEDCGSRNGTFVRGVKADGQVRLQDGDDIGVAGIRMQFRVIAALPGPEITRSSD